MDFRGREERQLERARCTGYLDQRNQGREALRRAYERWCWMMKIPIVRVLRQSPRSRFSTVVLEMYTTPNTLGAEGQQAIENLYEKACRKSERSLGRFGGEFRNIPHAAAPRFGRGVFRVATHLGYYLPDLALLDARLRKYGQEMVERRAATA